MSVTELGVTPTEVQGEMFELKAFTRKPARMAFRSAASIQISDPEASFLAAAEVDDPESPGMLLRCEVFCYVKGLKREYGSVTFDLVVADAALDIEG